MKMFKFTTTDATEEMVLRSQAGQIYSKACKGEKLTRKEKNDVTRWMFNATYKRENCVPVLGWFLDFSGVGLKKYLVKFEEGATWYEHTAFDKTAIRALYKGIRTIKRIIELPE